MTNKNNQITGNLGENLACEFLKKQGFEIIERNFRIKGGEIDIVAKDKDTWVFVEVKTRHTLEYGHPAEAVTPWKIKFLTRASQFYFAKYDLWQEPARIDVVTVDLLDPSHPKIELIPNVTG